jgi:hypothetical protein
VGNGVGLERLATALEIAACIVLVRTGISSSIILHVTSSAFGTSKVFDGASLPR